MVLKLVRESYSTKLCLYSQTRVCNTPQLTPISRGIFESALLTSSKESTETQIGNPLLEIHQFATERPLHLGPQIVSYFHVPFNSLSGLICTHVSRSTLASVTFLKLRNYCRPRWYILSRAKSPLARLFFPI